MGFEGQSLWQRGGVRLTRCGFLLSCVFGVAGVLPPELHVLPLCVRVSVPTCYLDLSVSGIPSPEGALWFYYRSMFVVKLLHRSA